MIRLIEVTQDDIENGVQGDCDKCAIALALRREYKTDKVNWNYLMNHLLMMKIYIWKQ